MCTKLAVIVTAAATNAVIVFLCALELWIPGAVLISVSDDHKDGKYLAGFILMLVAAGLSGCGFLYGCLFGAATTLAEESEV